MAAKYVSYRSRFLMQNPNRISLRFLILNMLLTLAKTAKLEKEQQLLKYVIERMKILVIDQYGNFHLTDTDTDMLIITDADGWLGGWKI